MKNPLVWTWVLRVLLAVVLFTAGGAKLLHPAELQSNILRYRLIGDEAAWWGAAFLPVFELVIASGLLFWRQSAAPAALTSLLVLIFIAALIAARWRDLDLQCGCFGLQNPTTAPPYGWWLIRDFGLLVASVSLWLLTSDAKPLTR